MPTLIVTESSAKARTIGSVLRNEERDSHWITVACPGVDADWPRKGRGSGLTDALRPKFNIRNRAVLNKMIQEASEAEEILIATEDSRNGEALAYHFKKEILEKMPNKVVRRVRIRSLDTKSVVEAIEKKDNINEQLAEAQMAGRVIDRLIHLHLNESVGYTLGRALVPGMAVLKSMFKPGKAQLIVEYSHHLFGDQKTTFMSDLVPLDDAKAAMSWIEVNPIPKLQRQVEEDLIAHPPRVYETHTLIRDGIDLLGLKGIEVISQANSLFDAGLITSPLFAGTALSWDVLSQCLEKIKALAGQDYCGDAFSWSKSGSESCHPIDMSVDPSSVPKPVRPLYRMIWSRTLAACAVFSRVDSEEVSFVVPEGNVTMKANSIKIKKHGHDRLGMGLFLRDTVVHDDLDFAYQELWEDGWPTEADLIEKLSKKIPLVNPAAVVKAMENLDYVRFRGSCVVPTFTGHSMLKTVSEKVPEMMSPSFFSQIEYRLSRIEEGEFSWDDVVPEYKEWIDARSL